MDHFKQRTIFVALMCIGSICALLLLWQARSILLVLFAGCICALVLTQLIAATQSWLHVRRGIAFGIALGFLAVAAAAWIWFRGPVLIQQLGDLQIDITAAVQQILSRIQAHEWAHWVIGRLADPDQASKTLALVFSRVGDAMYLTASAMTGIFLIMITSIYLAAEPEFYLRGIRRVISAKWRATFQACFVAATRKLREWLLAKLISMVTIGLLVTIGLVLLEIPLAGTLGMLAALLTFVPNLGPILSFLPAALLAFAISPGKGVLTLALYCVAHLLEGNVVTPIAERTIVRLPPALTLAIQLLLASVAGALGFVLAAPLTAVMLGVLDELLPSDSDPA